MLFPVWIALGSPRQIFILILHTALNQGYICSVVHGLNVLVTVNSMKLGLYVTHLSALVCIHLSHNDVL